MRLPLPCVPLPCLAGGLAGWLSAALPSPRRRCLHAVSRALAPPPRLPRRSPDPSLTVVLAAKGYPGSYAKCGIISGLEGVSGAKVFHAGTAMKGGQVVSAGACEGGKGAQLRREAGLVDASAVGSRARCRPRLPCPPPNQAGGRVLGVTATGKDVLDAQQKAYAAVDAISFPDGFCRRDIGWRAVARLREGQQ